ncbi:MAG: thiamine pyrophosphate-dependent enzyme [Candidatus Gracilibacteria bacterium]|nr:thiamine pyrophosphate-dependent enzyme [Candidatus Gracilibacteria bacterium]
MTNLKDLETRDKSNWCPGCGNFGIQTAIKQAIVNLSLDPANVVISTGIGCGSKINQWIETYGFAGLHGRSLPVAMGVKLANHNLTVIDVGGDGDGYGIGMGHFIHNMRRNFDMTYLVENNQVYGLTLGQTSPTSDKGMKGPSTPFGIIEDPINPIRLALSSDCTFVARGFAGDIPHLTGLIEQGISHKGFALIDIFQPCVTFNKINTYAYFRQKVYKLEEAGHDATNLGEAFARAGESEKLPIGIFYKVEKPTYESSDVGLKDGVPRAQVDISEIDVSEVEESFM